MSAHKISARFAKSLIDLATERGTLERVTEDIQGIKQALGSREFLMLLRSPIINIDKKRQILKTIFGEQTDVATLSFLDLLVVKGREGLLPEIIEEYLAQYNARHKYVTVTLTTAAPLSPEAIAGIEAKIAKDLTQYNKVILKTKINPDIIGGFQLEFDNKLYDASLLRQLEQFRQEFKENLYIKEF